MRHRRRRHLHINDDEWDVPPWLQATIDEPRPERQPKSLLVRIRNGIIITLLFGLVLAIGRYFYVNNEDRGLEKEKIQAAIISIVENGGDLSAVKHAYMTYPISKISLWDIFGKIPDAYDKGTALSNILDDLRTAQFLDTGKKTKNPEFLPRLEGLIKEHQTINPFDKLELTQKDHFIEVKDKLGENYNLVERQMNKIADEMAVKNRLVTEYLADSEKSLRLSQIGLFLALLTILYEIIARFFRNRRLALEKQLERAYAEQKSQEAKREASTDPTEEEDPPNDPQAKV